MEDRRTVYLNPQYYLNQKTPSYLNFSPDPTFENNALGPLLENLPAGALVLDLGCNVGVETRELEKAGMKVIPLDPNIMALRLVNCRFPPWLTNPLARKILSLLALNPQIARFLGLNFLESSARRIQGDGFHLPLRENAVDACIIKHVLTFGDNEERLQLLKEAFRVLKPGGRLVVYVEYMEYSCDLERIGPFEVFVPVAKTDEHDFSPYAVYALTPAELEWQLKAAGFENIRIKVIRSTSDRFGAAENQLLAFARKRAKGEVS